LVPKEEYENGGVGKYCADQKPICDARKGRKRAERERKQTRGQKKGRKGIGPSDDPMAQSGWGGGETRRNSRGVWSSGGKSGRVRPADKGTIKEKVSSSLQYNE